MSIQRRYWDSTAFIALFAEEEGRVDLCQGVLDAAERDEVEIVTSALTLSEVVHIRGRERLNAELEDQLVAFFEQPYIIIVDLISAWQKTLFSRAQAVLSDQLDYILQPDCSANAHRIGHFPAQTAPFT